MLQSDVILSSINIHRCLILPTSTQHTREHVHEKNRHIHSNDGDGATAQTLSFPFLCEVDPFPKTDKRRYKGRLGVLYTPAPVWSGERTILVHFDTPFVTLERAKSVALFGSSPNMAT